MTWVDSGYILGTEPHWRIGESKGRNNGHGGGTVMHLCDKETWSASSSPSCNYLRVRGVIMECMTDRHRSFSAYCGTLSNRIRWRFPNIEP